ncbi:hypothetical protein PRIPAC_78509 [Pristionchus pacificus]|uniref:G protein-coupled receptor n=1 Tax=Pristionchus pacificus TaxID=54126 RepID=A0A2A6C3M6_PRIPA|nr:hypothetical protein PRIPAC_78509 [Pristionchus pacificus]|eukprot:PDM72621.1 G protein-coupled receptor [Pristionchus pacificus]
MRSWALPNVELTIHEIGQFVCFIRIVKRGLSKVGEGSFNLYTNNCEHLARWIRNVKLTSSQFLPEMGVAAGSFAVLSIGIDRFLSISMPNYYCLGIFHDVICNMPSVFHDNAVSLWAYSSAAVNVVAFGVYVLTWRLIKAQCEHEFPE